MSFITAQNDLLNLCRIPRAAARTGILVSQILEASARLAEETDERLLKRWKDLKWQAVTGTPLPELLTLAYPLVRESARRAVGQSHYPVQLTAGVCLATGGVAEMQTGEGKTLTALLPAALYALAGQGVHVVTANDYLAQRDADFARTALAPLGLSVGCVTSEIEHAGRRAEYACDITYGSSREFGFDFLRDQLALDAHPSAGGAAACVQRGQFFALVDEADNVLLDDACTPLLIAQQDTERTPSKEALAWARWLADCLVSGEHYLVNHARKSVDLTKSGLRELHRCEKPLACRAMDATELRGLITNAVAAGELYQVQRDYLVHADSGVTIIDASTGRLAEGRVWRDGMQQAIEVKEGLAPSPITSTIARCTVQSYFLRYQHLAGLTGTARTAEREFRQTYSLGVTRIPTHRACQRKELPARIFSTTADKLAAVVADLSERQSRGGAVLVGVPSVDDSDELSQLLRQSNIEHEVLNCREHRREAEIVAQAGQPGRVTIATNMAGRGTDIQVHPDVLRQGGLHVLVTQMHPSARIDRQLEGRAARQGEPGSYQYYLSLEDRLVADGATGLSPQYQGSGELPSRWVRWFRAAQKRAEERQRRQRRALLKAEEQREKACRRMGLVPVLEAID